MLVFDAQPLLSYFQGEASAPAVRDLLNEIASGREEACCSTVNLAEIRYVLLRRAPEVAEGHMAWLIATGVTPASADDVWQIAAEIKARHGIGLADAFAIATARQQRGKLIAGTDPDLEAAKREGVALRRV